MKLRVVRDTFDEDIVFGAEYLDEDALNSWVSFNAVATIINLHIDLEDFANEKYRRLYIADSISELIDKCHKFTMPIVKNDSLEPQYIFVGVDYEGTPTGKDRDGACAHYKKVRLNKFTAENVTENSADLYFEFIPYRVGKV